MYDEGLKDGNGGGTRRHLNLGLQTCLAALLEGAQVCASVI
jgi:hypothetical protein